MGVHVYHRAFGADDMVCFDFSSLKQVGIEIKVYPGAGILPTGGILRITVGFKTLVEQTNGSRFIYRSQLCDLEIIKSFVAGSE